MAIEHDFFGLLTTSSDGSIFWSETVEFGDHAVTVDVTAPDENDVTIDGLDVAASLISGLENVDAVSRRGMLAEVDDRASEVTEYILRQQESYGDEIELMLVDVSGDIAVDILRSMRLMSMTILADEHGSSEPFAVLEYSLDPDDSDDVLLVNLSEDGSVHSVMSGD